MNVGGLEGQQENSGTISFIRVSQQGSLKVLSSMHLQVSIIG